MYNIKNRLILSLAHRPLTQDDLEELVNRTTSTSLQILQELEDEKSEKCVSSERRDDCNSTPHSTNPPPHDGNKDIKESKYAKDGIQQQQRQKQQPLPKSQPQSDQQQQQQQPQTFFENRNPTVHVLLTGSPSITQPGRSFENWETRCWTPGEHVLSQYIQKVGLHHFHRIPKDGEVRLNGKLVDVKQKDFTVYESLQEQLLREFHWIADNVMQHFNLYAKVPVSEAIILYPEGFVVEEEEEGGIIGVQDVVDMIRTVFQSEWSQKKGPLMGVRIRVEMVGSLK